MAEPSGKYVLLRMLRTTLDQKTMNSGQLEVGWRVEGQFCLPRIEHRTQVMHVDSTLRIGCAANGNSRHMGKRQSVWGGGSAGRKSCLSIITQASFPATS